MSEGQRALGNRLEDKGCVFRFCISSQDTSVVPGTEGMLGERLFHDLPSERANELIESRLRGDREGAVKKLTEKYQ